MPQEVTHRVFEQHLGVVARTPANRERERLVELQWLVQGERPKLVFSDIGGAVAESPPTWDPPSIYVVNADGTGVRWLADGEYPDWSR